MPGARPWTEEEKAVVGKVPDEAAARQLGRPLDGVRKVRRESGQMLVRTWTEAELALVGTEPDALVAAKLGRSLKPSSTGGRC